jgi:hypothetical protein
MEQLKCIIEEVDNRHRDGKAETIQLMQNFVVEKYGIEVCKMTMSNYFKILGLSYKPIKNKIYNFGAHRMDLLIKCSGNYVKWLAYPTRCPFVFVFTDESYVNRQHGLHRKTDDSGL